MQRPDPPSVVTGPEFDAWNKKSLQDWERESREMKWEYETCPMITTFACILIVMTALILMCR